MSIDIHDLVAVCFDGPSPCQYRQRVDPSNPAAITRQLTNERVARCCCRPGYTVGNSWSNEVGAGRLSVAYHLLDKKYWQWEMSAQGVHTATRRLSDRYTTGGATFP